ncbi:MAG: hypothetical protein SV377_02705, partial [Halobacteria archaeon]|nr:hypothetical protein [Halobacteria archaeon]
MKEKTSFEDVKQLTGTPVERREDRTLITGKAKYTDDLSEPRMVHLAFHRSQYGHARIKEIDTSSAEEHEGVIRIVTWEDVQESGTPGVIPLATSYLEN